VYRRSQSAIADAYAVCDRLPRREQFGIANQLRRAAVSVTVNIVEGSKRRTAAEFARFLNIAEGSAAEARTLLIQITKLKLDSTARAATLQGEYAQIELMLRALQRRLLS
jgi:four helix bundle protein